MTRQLPFITALLLLCSITLSASDATNYRSGSGSGPDNVLSLPGLDMISAPVVACTELYNDGFETSFGNWIDGGSNCARSNSFPNFGSWSVELKGGPASEISTPTNNFTGVGVTVALSFYAQGFENGEGLLLEYATNSAGSFSVFTAWIAGNNLVNNTRYNVTVPMNSVTWTNQSRFRIRCDASANDDRVYIDDIYVRSCLNYPALQAQEVNIPPTVSNERPVFVNPEDVILSPNPVTSELHLDGIPMEGTAIDIFNASGSIMRSVRLSANTVDVSQLLPGLYFMRIGKDDQVIIKRFIKE